jgi:hypothetical protein
MSRGNVDAKLTLTRVVDANLSIQPLERQMRQSMAA